MLGCRRRAQSRKTRPRGDEVKGRTVQDIIALPRSGDRPRCELWSRRAGPWALRSAWTVLLADGELSCVSLRIFTFQCRDAAVHRGGQTDWVDGLTGHL